MIFGQHTFTEKTKITKNKKIKPIKIKKHQNPINNKKFTSYKKSSFETNMQSFQEIDNIYENYFSDAEEDEISAPISVQTLLEGENIKEWQRIGFGLDTFEVKVDNAEKKLLQVAIKEAKVISGRIFQELKKR